MSVEMPANTPAIDREERRRDWLQRATLAAIVVVLIGMGFTLYYRFGDASKQSTTLQALGAVLQSNERADCRTQYNSDRNTVLEHAQVVERQNVAAFGAYLLGQPGANAGQLQANKVALDAANTAVQNLPTLDDMVTHGYRLRGVTHPACPTVR